jgi:hypothetical protein
MRNYQEGDIMFVISADEDDRHAVKCRVTECWHAEARQVEEEHLRADGFKDHDDMVAGLQRFYPNLKMDSIVTVILFERL